MPYMIGLKERKYHGLDIFYCFIKLFVFLLTYIFPHGPWLSRATETRPLRVRVNISLPRPLLMSYLQKNIKWGVTASERQNIMSAESLLFKFVFNILHQKSNALVKSVDLVEWVFFHCHISDISVFLQGPLNLSTCLVLRGKIQTPFYYKLFSFFSLFPTLPPAFPAAALEFLWLFDYSIKEILWEQSVMSFSFKVLWVKCQYLSFQQRKKPLRRETTKWVLKPQCAS